ncbi:unnamed protein product [Musa textilis]
MVWALQQARPRAPRLSQSGRGVTPRRRRGPRDASDSSSGSGRQVRRPSGGIRPDRGRGTQPGGDREEPSPPDHEGFMSDPTGKGSAIPFPCDGRGPPWGGPTTL